MLSTKIFWEIFLPIKEEKGFHSNSSTTFVRSKVVSDRSKIKKINIILKGEFKILLIAGGPYPNQGLFLPDHFSPF